jgi:hypothetical protein
MPRAECCELIFVVSVWGKINSQSLLSSIGFNDQLLQAPREYQEKLRARNEALEEIRKGKGAMRWIRKGNPSLVEMGF